MRYLLIILCLTVVPCTNAGVIGDFFLEGAGIALDTYDWYTDASYKQAATAYYRSHTSGHYYSDYSNLSLKYRHKLEQERIAAEAKTRKKKLLSDIDDAERLWEEFQSLPESNKLHTMVTNMREARWAEPGLRDAKIVGDEQAKRYTAVRQATVRFFIENYGSELLKTIDSALSSLKEPGAYEEAKRLYVIRLKAEIEHLFYNPEYEFAKLSKDDIESIRDYATTMLPLAKELHEAKEELKTASRVMKSKDYAKPKAPEGSATFCGLKKTSYRLYEQKLRKHNEMMTPYVDAVKKANKRVKEAQNAMAPHQAKANEWLRSFPRQDNSGLPSFDDIMGMKTE